jgi:hypothetical protein
VVIFPEEAHCDDVPLWDLQSWDHPGGSFLQSASLCGSVLTGWRGKGSHSSGWRQDVHPDDNALTSLSGGGTRAATDNSSDGTITTEAPSASPTTTSPTSATPTTMPTMTPTMTPTPTPTSASPSAVCAEGATLTSDADLGLVLCAFPLLQSPGTFGLQPSDGSAGQCPSSTPGGGGSISNCENFWTQSNLFRAIEQLNAVRE